MSHISITIAIPVDALSLTATQEGAGEAPPMPLTSLIGARAEGPPEGAPTDGGRVEEAPPPMPVETLEAAAVTAETAAPPEPMEVVAKAEHEDDAPPPTLVDVVAAHDVDAAPPPEPLDEL